MQVDGTVSTPTGNIHYVRAERHTTAISLLEEWLGAWREGWQDSNLFERTQQFIQTDRRPL